MLRAHTKADKPLWVLKPNRAFTKAYSSITRYFDGDGLDEKEDR